MGVLDDDSSNIVQLVKDNYDVSTSSLHSISLTKKIVIIVVTLELYYLQKISSNVEMRTEQDEDFTVSFSTKCLGFVASWIK